jgi:hypothetical protein
MMARRPKYAPKPDANQGKLVKDLHEAMSCWIIDVSRFLPTPDILVWAYDLRLDRWRWTLWEIKTESGKLTAKQQELLDEWPSAILVARCADDVLREYGRL